MADNNKLSGKNLAKLIIIPILILILLAGSFFALTQGIIEILKQTTKEAIGEIAGAANKGIKWLGLARVSRGLPTFVVNREQVETLRTNLENQAIRTDVCGMTEVRLRKMLLAYAVSSSLSDTVCAVETTEEDIINDFKEKNKKYKDDDSVTINTVLDKYGKTSSTSKWKVSNPNYTLYNVDDSSKVFFYFKDTDKVFGDNEDAWFLGAMGATSIETADGTSLTYVTDPDFKMIESNFNAASVGDKLNSQAYKQMLSSYTRDGDVIKLYTVDISQKEYYFSFENKSIQKIEEPKQKDENIKYNPDEDSVYNIEVQEINLADSVDLSKYAIPIELMMDFLNITGSGEFLETFIDYSLDQIETSVMAYTLETEEVAYNQRKYNIDKDFVLEMYDIIDYGVTTVAEFDEGEDNFKAYYDIVYNREYNGANLPENRVTSIPDYKSINYNELEFDTDKKFKVEALETYLKTAYDPNGGFNLGDIEVAEVIVNKKVQNKWQFMVNKIGTWYGNFTYTLTDPEIVYSISEEPDEVTEEKYNEYNHLKMTNFTSESGNEKEVRYLYKRLKSQVEDEIALGKIDISKCEVQESNDIYDNAMKTENGADNREHFQNWAMRGLAAIAEEDNGEKNARISGGTGIDYIYCKYKEINVKRADTVYKRKIEVIDQNNIVQTTSNDDLDQKLKDFLELLRNKTGKIPTSKGSEGGFTARNANPSIVVKYADIYDGTIPAGDLLLDNGALMLFELLESSENTQGLVNVFKYLAYLYTGTDYGVTNAAGIATLFNTYQYSGTNYIVNTALSSKDIVLNEEQLREAISKSFSGQGKTNLENCISQFMKIQNDNYVNAVFAIAVTTIESSNGTDWDAIDSSTYNWYSIGIFNNGKRVGWKSYSSFGDAVLDFGSLINGSNYFKAGKYTVKDIAPTYCNEQWGNDVMAEMTRIYNSIGIYVNVGGTEENSGNFSTFTVGDRTYTNYKQITEGYKQYTLAGYPDCNLYNSGCAITSDAIIASGFGAKVTPVDVNNFAKISGYPTVHERIIEHYTGIRGTWVYTDLKAGVIDQLRRGYPVMVQATSGKYAGSSGTHFFVILSVSEDGNKVYISNPSSYKDKVTTGWVDSNDLNTIKRYLKMG